MKDPVILHSQSGIAPLGVVAVVLGVLIVGMMATYAFLSVQKTTKVNLEEQNENSAEVNQNSNESLLTTNNSTNSAVNLSDSAKTNANTNRPTGTDGPATGGFTEDVNGTTYTNTVYDFSFTSKQTALCNVLGCPGDSNSVEFGLVTMHVADIESAASPSDWLKQSAKQSSSLVITPSALAGEEAVSVFTDTYETSLNFNLAGEGNVGILLTKGSRATAAFHQGYAYIIIFQNTLGNESPDYSIYNEVLTTFAFL